MSKKKYRTLTDEIISASKNTPGVGKYNISNSFKNVSKFSTVRKGRFG
jgi:hypothetical protein